MNPRLTRKINFENRKPFGIMASFEGYEPGNSIGVGETEEEASDWLIAEEAILIANEHEKARNKKDE